MDDEKPATPDEEAAAAALAEALDGKMDAADHEDAAAIQMIRAAAGHEAPLGELRARGIARAAVEEAKRRSEAPRPASRTRRAGSWTLSGLVAMAAVAAAAAFFVAGGVRGPREVTLPTELQSRTAGLLVPGPFPATQTAAQRLDVVTTDRLIALREVRLRAVAAGRGRR